MSAITSKPRRTAKDLLDMKVVPVITFRYGARSNDFRKRYEAGVRAKQLSKGLERVFKEQGNDNIVYFRAKMCKKKIF